MKLHWVIFFLLIASPLSGQPYFEGTLTFKHSYSSDRLNIDSLRVLGNSSIYAYKGPLYKGIIFGADTAVYVYNGLTAKCIYMTMSGGELYCMDYSKPVNDGLRDMKAFRKKEIVNGYPCRMVETYYEGHTTRSWYHTSIRIDPALYGLHVAYRYNEQMQLAKGGILVKSEIVYPGYSVTIELVNIFPREFSTSEFNPDYFTDCR